MSSVKKKDGNVSSPQMGPTCTIQKKQKKTLLAQIDNRHNHISKTTKKLKVKKRPDGDRSHKHIKQCAHLPKSKFFNIIELPLNKGKRRTIQNTTEETIYSTFETADAQR